MRLAILDATKERFIVFGYDTYYPCGGLDDFCGYYKALADVPGIIMARRDYVEVLDMQTGEVWEYVDGKWRKSV